MSHSLAAAASRGAARRPTTGRTPARAPARPARPPLRVVQAPAAERGRTVVVVLALLLLGVGLVTLLLINTALAQGSFRLHDLQARSSQLTDEQQALRESIDAAAAPQQLAHDARELGMVPSESAAFVRLSDGKVLGVAEPAKAADTHTVAGSAASGATSTTSRATGAATSSTKKTDSTKKQTSSTKKTASRR
jgi:hypothetical protein